MKMHIYTANKDGENGIGDFYIIIDKKEKFGYNMVKHHFGRRRKPDELYK
ncbi:MAG TPA: hypothetical protein VFC41_04855 [Anaerovoracaceae bacterium]|nr:hypothetical protein [Anaerovoracaceae bacterium]